MLAAPLPPPMANAPGLLAPNVDPGMAPPSAPGMVPPDVPGAPGADTSQGQLPPQGLPKGEPPAPNDMDQGKPIAPNEGPGRDGPKPGMMEISKNPPAPGPGSSTEQMGDMGAAPKQTGPMAPWSNAGTHKTPIEETAQKSWSVDHLADLLRRV